MKKEIYELIESSEGLRIFEIQELLEINKVDLNDVLDSSDDFVQDSSYRWHLKDSEYIDKSKGKETLEPKLEGVESDIANYYLSCLAKEDAGKVLFWAESKYDDYDYFEIDSLENVDGEWNLNEAFKAASQKNNKQRFKKQLYLAYPLNLSITPKGTKIVEPLFLIPFEDGTLNDLFTSINQSVFRNYSQGSASDISAEIREITNDLKIGDIHVMPRIDEISSKIYSIKSDWNWKEKIDANNLTSGNIRNKDEAGIYNKAAVVLVNKSMYTFGLSSELETLRNQKLENENALSDWLDLSFVDSKTSDDDPIIEPLEMNLEQREAVKSALNKKLTVITGPPGTGKSQVVTNILVNASLRGKRVLFASKNNKAVDVVHARANGICDKEFVNRLGNNYESNLSVQINKILSLQGNKNEIMDEFELMEANYKDMLKEKVHIDKSLDEIRKIRNKVSATNKDYKEIFEEYDKKTLDTFFKNKTELLSIWDNYVEKVRLSKKENHDLFRQIFWSFFEEKRLSEKNSAREEIINFFK